MRFCLLFIASLVGASAGLDASAAQLGADRAAIVGGWTATAMPGVENIYLAPVVRKSGCLKYAVSPFPILSMLSLVGVKDHPSSDGPAMRRVHDVKPGLYALFGVGWTLNGQANPLNGAPDGISRQRGAIWVVDVPAGSVTDIGIWTVSSPFAQRYVIDSVELDRDLSLAATLAKKAGPLVIAKPFKSEVVDADAPCPTPTDPSH